MTWIPNSIFISFLSFLSSSFPFYSSSFHCLLLLPQQLSCCFVVRLDLRDLFYVVLDELKESSC